MEKKRFRIHINIGTIIFFILFVYICITLILFASRKHVETYQVISGPLSGNDTFTALIKRDEEVIKSSADGYVNYFVNRASKVSKSDIICGVTQSQAITSGTVIDEENNSELRKISSDAVKKFNNVNFDDIYDLQYSISNVIWDASALSAASGNFYSASTDGTVSLYTDGYEYFDESSLTADLGQNTGYTAKRLDNQDQVSTGTDLYRIVKDESWSIYFPVTDAQLVKLASVSRVKVRFLADDNVETGRLSFLTENNCRFAKVTFDSGMIRYIDDRFIDIELISNIETGLKIPSSSVVTKDFYTIPSDFLVLSGANEDTGFLLETVNKDGTKSTVFTEATVYSKAEDENSGQEYYYIDKSVFNDGDILVRTDSDKKFTVNDTQPLEGAYCVNKGYCVFRKISIIDQNSDFCIVEDGTSYGLSLYDFIVKDGSNVKENDIVN